MTPNVTVRTVPARTHRGFPMKRVALSVLLLFNCCAAIASTLPPELSNTRVPQPKGMSDVPGPGSILSGGDTFGTAKLIPFIPYNDTGDTCPFHGNYAAPCMFNSGPDVVYVYTPTVNQCVRASLCGSTFDTGLWVFDATTGASVACQDDSPQCGLQSYIPGVGLTAGHVYYIIICGYVTACGSYQLYVAECEPPPLCPPCPPDAVLEGEPVCGDGYVDVFNGGCNSTPPVTLTLPCSPNLTICGAYGTFNANLSRDTDWYQFTLTAPMAMSVSVSGGGLTGSALAIIDNLCAPTVICSHFGPSAQCATVSCNANLGPGTYRIFVSSLFDNTPCNSPYTLRVQGMACPTNAQATSWGKLKTIYR